MLPRGSGGVLLVEQNFKTKVQCSHDTKLTRFKKLKDCACVCVCVSLHPYPTT